MTTLPWAIRKRLTAIEIEALVGDFLAGTHQKDLADRHNMSLYSVKQLLQETGARRYKRRSPRT